MSKTPIDDLLSVDTLTGLIRRFANQAENRACTALFASRAKRIQPMGRSAKWEEVEFSRHLAPVTGVESPHTQTRRLGVKQRASPMAMVKLYKDLPSSHLFLDRAPGKDTQDAEAILADELQDLANLIENTKEFLACGTLLGRLRVNKQTVPGSEIEFDLDWDVPEEASLDWSDPNVLLRSEEFGRLKKAYKAQSGLRAANVIVEADAEGFLVKNQEIRDFAKEVLSLQILRNANREGSNPQWSGLGGFDWRFTDGTYKPEAGPVTSYWPSDVGLILPEEARLRSVLGWAEGRVFVPSGGVFATAEQATGLVREVRGYYAYAKLRDDPVGIRIYAGWYGLPVVLNPLALLRVRIRPQAAPAPAPTPTP